MENEKRIIQELTTKKIICRRNYVLKIGIQLNIWDWVQIFFSKYGYKSGNILSLKVMFSVKKSDNHRIDKRLGKWRKEVNKSN